MANFLFLMNTPRVCMTLFAFSYICQPSTVMADEKPIKIVLVGDSTVTDHAGWGKAFGELFNEHVTVVNLAAGGRSSRSFRTEGRWGKCLELKPDYILIQFGHNDQPGKGPARETDPETSYTEFLIKYVDEAIEIGAQPILVTSLTRRNFDENGKIQSTLIPYATAVKRVAQQKQVPVIGLHTSSLMLCEKLGPEGCVEISPDPKKNGPDRTHLNEKGAKLIAPLVVEELQKVVPTIASYVK